MNKSIKRRLVYSMVAICALWHFNSLSSASQLTPMPEDTILRLATKTLKAPLYDIDDAMDRIQITRIGTVTPDQTDDLDPMTASEQQEKTYQSFLERICSIFLRVLVKDGLPKDKYEEFARFLETLCKHDTKTTLGHLLLLVTKISNLVDPEDLKAALEQFTSLLDTLKNATQDLLSEEEFEQFVSTITTYVNAFLPVAAEWFSKENALWTLGLTGKIGGNLALYAILYSLFAKKSKKMSQKI